MEVSSTSLRMELSMSDTRTVSPLRQRMIEDMAARTLNPHTQRSHISSCKRFAAAEAFARYSDARRGSAFPTAPHRERSEHLQPQPDHDRGAVFVPRHAASPRSGG